MAFKLLKKGPILFAEFLGGVCDEEIINFLLEIHESDDNPDYMLLDVRGVSRLQTTRAMMQWMLDYDLEHLPFKKVIIIDYNIDGMRLLDYEGYVQVGSIDHAQQLFVTASR